MDEVMALVSRGYTVTIAQVKGLTVVLAEMGDRTLSGVGGSFAEAWDRLMDSVTSR
jgi:hypothetical protein